MNFELPNERGFTIYTKPKCGYCEKAKELLSEADAIIEQQNEIKSKKVEYDEQLTKIATAEVDLDNLILVDELTRIENLTYFQVKKELEANCPFYATTTCARRRKC